MRKTLFGSRIPVISGSSMKPERNVAMIDGIVAKILRMEAANRRAAQAAAFDQVAAMISHGVDPDEIARDCERRARELRAPRGGALRPSPAG
jgi:hypothetical protein